jgi:uncharacterized protein Yka (UPF0111/DUF47 family)
MDVTYPGIYEDMKKRDEQDSSRAVAPLKPAEDAVLVDTSGNTLQESIDMLFSKMNVLQKDPAILDKIRSLESVIDKIELKLGDIIFGSDMELAAKMQTFGLVERICDISDIIEDIADKIQIMLVTRKN